MGPRERALENVAVCETVRLGKALMIVASAAYIIGGDRG